MKRLALIFLAAIILVSCSGGSYSRLQEIESYMENEPKRALEELRRMNAEEIKGARNIAKHASKLVLDYENRLGKQIAQTYKYK